MSGIALVMGMLFVLVVYLRRRYMPGIPNVKLIATVNPEYVSTGKYCNLHIHLHQNLKSDNFSVQILVGNLKALVHFWRIWE